MIDKLRYPELHRCLYRWKFAQAVTVVARLVSGAHGDLPGGIDERDQRLILALAACFGDIGWHNGGQVEVLIAAALATLIPDAEADDDVPDGIAHVVGRAQQAVHGGGQLELVDCRECVRSVGFCRERCERGYPTGP